MKKAFYIGVVIFFIGKVPALAQAYQEFKVIEIKGYWQTDSASQFGPKERLLPKAVSPVFKTLSNDMDRAIKSREYIFDDEGIFTARWVMGGRQSLVKGRWDMVERNKITIEVDGMNTQYLIRANGREGILLIPIKPRHGEIHELYFIKRKEK